MQRAAKVRVIRFSCSLVSTPEVPHPPLVSHDSVGAIFFCQEKQCITYGYCLRTADIPHLSRVIE